MKSVKKKFFASHAKSSAAVISLAIHGLFLLVAVTFVAVKVIQKGDQNFEAKPITRPKMQLKKLQVPVTVKKKRPKPKLRKRIVAKPRMNQNMPDIKMPEITGIKGGIGNANGSGLGAAASVGFSMPEIEIFGVKGQGEKIVLMLQADAPMMYDNMGGIPAYTIIKQELIRIINELPSTALFNVFVYDHHGVAMPFPNLVSANETNTKKAEEWLMPLNAVKEGMREGDWGTGTVGPGGTVSRERIYAGKMRDTEKVGGGGNKPQLRDWFFPSMLAHKMQADTIFSLCRQWHLQRVATTDRHMTREEWDQTPAGVKWNNAYKNALKQLDEEQARRKAAGQPPKALERNEWALRREYYPNIEAPPQPRWYNYSPKEMAEGFMDARAQFRPQNIQTRSGMRKKKSRKIDFSYNVVQFVPEGEQASEASKEKFKQLTNICNGEYQTISGMKAIRNYVKSEE